MFKNLIMTTQQIKFIAKSFTAVDKDTLAANFMQRSERFAQERGIPNSRLNYIHPSFIGMTKEGPDSTQYGQSKKLLLFLL
jgi:hypothetical protein